MASGQEYYTPETPKRPVVLLDYYHRTDLQNKIGSLVVTGSYGTRMGRYGINDFPHVNSFDPVMRALEDEFALIMHKEAFTKQNLEKADIVFMYMPDLPDIESKIPIISDAEIESLDIFVKRGGSLILMVNAFDTASTKLSLPIQFRKLFNQFGIDWNENNTSYVDIVVGSEHPYFYDIDVLHYGGGCTFKYLDSAKDIKTLLYVHGDFGNEEIEGSGIVLARHGKGKVLGVGDTGSWTANMSRPWAQNESFLVQFFRLVKKDTGIRPAQFKQNQSIDYKMSISRINCFTDRLNVNKLEQPHFKDFSINNRPLPYFEASGDVILKCVDVSKSNVSTFQITVNDYKRFDEPAPFPQGYHVTIKSNRLGSISDVSVSDVSLMKLSPDLIHLIGFIPNDGVRIGDRWNKIMHLPLPPVRGADIPSVRPVNVKMCYVKDENINGRNCRLMLSTAAVWLDDIRVTPEEFLQHAGINYKFQSGKGGRYEVKREQWIDKETGVVVRAKFQARVIVWFKDARKTKKYTTADIDG
ncbi:MAG: hypothetical protein U9R60_17555, partial [Bacteroidota bacterium]|nr:hypothetical protein [Bacteroidota bacterium]